MTAKQLIDRLSGLNEGAQVVFSLGLNKSELVDVAKAILTKDARGELTETDRLLAVTDMHICHAGTADEDIELSVYPDKMADDIVFLIESFDVHYQRTDD